mmetsp:Transcript_92081/g.214010  ORF Transcript_92081/g.214010 Transcript_92081/m.214010 type:complete len:205 (+) Transcript_92081:27-641(+)
MAHQLVAMADSAGSDYSEVLVSLDEPVLASCDSCGEAADNARPQAACHKRGAKIAVALGSVGALLLLVSMGAVLVLAPRSRSTVKVPAEPKVAGHQEPVTPELVQLAGAVYDCNAGYGDRYHGWTADKKTWCCTNFKKGCDGVSPAWVCLGGVGLILVGTAIACAACITCGQESVNAKEGLERVVIARKPGGNKKRFECCSRGC